MFLENELTGTLPFLRLLVAMIVGLAPIAVTIAIKMLLYRRRAAEDEASRLRANGNGQSKLPRTRSVRRHRGYSLVLPLPTTLEPHQPLALLSPGLAVLPNRRITATPLSAWVDTIKIGSSDLMLPISRMQENGGPDT